MEVMSGGITMFTGSPVEALSLLEAGRVRTLAVMLDERSETFPDAPTVKEAIGKNWSYANWFALVAPKGIDAEARDILYQAAARANARPEVQSSLKERGITPVWDAPGEFDAFAADFTAKARSVLEGRAVTDPGRATGRDRPDGSHGGAGLTGTGGRTPTDSFALAADVCRAERKRGCVFLSGAP